jgi:hypothetical protein
MDLCPLCPMIDRAIVVTVMVLVAAPDPFKVSEFGVAVQFAGALLQPSETVWLKPLIGVTVRV